MSDTQSGEPHNSEAEKTVIGSCVLWPEDFARAFCILKPDDFFGSHARLAWQTMSTIFERGQQPDIVMVANEAAERGGKDVSNFRAWIASTLDGLPRVTNLEEWAQIIREKANRRRLIRRCLGVVKAAGDDANSNDWLFEQLSTADAQIRGDNSVGVMPASALAPAALRNLEAYAAKKDGIQGLRTGMDCLDAISEGMREGQLILLAGRPARGKSALTSQIARYCARQDKRVLVFPMEMSARAVVERGLLSDSGVRKRDLLAWNSEARDAAWGDVARAAGALADLPMWFDKGECPTVGQMSATAQTHRDRHGLDLLVVDYVQRMTISSKSENRVYGIAENIQRLKSLAMRLKVPVLAAYQLDSVDESQEKRPTAANFAQCKQVAEAESDQIWFIHPIEPRLFNETKQPPMELIVDKNREGPTGVTKAIFDRERTRFYEMPEGYGEGA